MIHDLVFIVLPGILCVAAALVIQSCYSPVRISTVALILLSVSWMSLIILVHRDQPTAVPGIDAEDQEHYAQLLDRFNYHYLRRFDE